MAKIFSVLLSQQILQGYDIICHDKSDNRGILSEPKLQVCTFCEIEIRICKALGNFTNNSFYVFFLFALEFSKTWFDKIYDLNIDV